jgi:hypothetical protein
VNVRQVVIAILLLALRVPLAVLPLFMAPVRLGALVLLGLFAARFTVPELHLTALDKTSGSDPSWVALAALVGAVVLVLSRESRLAWRWRNVRAFDSKRRLEAWSHNGLRLSIVALVGTAVIGVLVVAGRLGAPGLDSLISGWGDSTAFERFVLIGAVLACAWVVPGWLLQPRDELGALDVVKVLAPVLLAGMPLLALIAPDNASTPLDSLSKGTPALLVHAVLAAVLVIAVLGGWAKIRWLVTATVATAVAVRLAEPIIKELETHHLPRAAMLLTVGAGLLVLIALLQLGGVALTALLAWVARGDGPIRGVAHTLTSLGLRGLAVLGMFVGTCLAAVVGQLLFQPFGRLGVPLGLWQGVFCAALVTVLVQHSPGKEPAVPGAAGQQ